MSTTATTPATETRKEPFLCAMTLAGFGSLGVLIHAGHEMIVLPEARPLFLLPLLPFFLALAWVKVPWTARRIGAGVFGVLGVVMPFEHVAKIFTGGAVALDYTGLFMLAGGVLLLWAAIRDIRFPVTAETR